MSRISKVEYMKEAQLWRDAAAAFLTATRDGRWIRARNPVDGNPEQLPYIYGVCAYLQELANNGLADRATVKRMRKRFAKQNAKQKQKSKDGFWWSTTTRAGQRKRVAALLKCAAECDRYGGDK